MFALMGKCAYTNLILYSNRFSTPSNKFWMWLQTLRREAICFDLAKYMRALTSLPPLARYSSMGRCLKSRLRVPCLPVTSTCFAFTVILMPLGTLRVSSDMRVFIAAKNEREWETDA